MSEKKISEMRSDVIESFIQIEAFVCKSITYYYFDYSNTEFEMDVLYNAYFPFQLKKDILNRILNDKTLLGYLETLAATRNYFAHIGMHFLKEQDGYCTLFIPHPKNKGRKLNLEDCYGNFKSIFPKAKKLLMKYAKQYGIPTEI